MSAAKELLAPFGVVPVVVLDRVEDAVPLGEALLGGGLGIVEVTFRTPAAPRAVQALAERLPELVIGAGTLLQQDDVDAAADAGAAFGVAPGLQQRIVEHAAQRGLPMIPGAATPGEVEAGLALGLDLLKLFPAAVLGGVALLDALAGPYPDTAFMPTGGIRPDTLGDYLRRPNVVACGGTWIAPSSLLDAGAFDEIRDRAAAAVALTHDHRASHRREHRHGA